ncbi:MAG: VWA domain-containing protein [Chitinivibrionales bacterium]|nr:VWA domain-containing protein [Chitinivibrionales bacterium]
MGVINRYQNYYKFSISASRFLALVLAATAVSASQLCTFSLDNCPETYNGKTIIVPNTVIAMSGNVHVCQPAQVYQNVLGGGAPSSIVFVIDNSQTMRLGSQPSDQWGYRFSVTRDLLDSLFIKSPNVEVSLVVFDDFLDLDATSTQYFSAYFQRLPATVDNQPNQAYMKFLKLDSLYKDPQHPNGIYGKDIIKAVLAIDTVTAGPSTYADLIYKPNFTTLGYTNINVAFDAVRASLTNAVNPKADQFVVFLSDGAPNGIDSAGAPANQFEAGTGMPTTYSIFFNSGGPGPQSIVNMITNIANNGYSTSNPKSKIQTIATSVSQRDTITNILLGYVQQTVLFVPQGTPPTLTVNDSIPVSSGANVVFAKPFPLQPNTTPFTYKITYHMVDAASNKLDTTFNVSFVVKRSDALPADTNIALSCRDTYSVTVAATIPTTEYGGDTGRFTFTRDDTAGVLAVHFSVGGTAANGFNYRNIPDSVVFMHGSHTATLDIIPKLDSVRGTDKTVILTVTGISPYSAGVPAVATVTITERMPLATVIAPVRALSANGGSAKFIIHRSDTLGLATVYFTLGGSARPDSDYQRVADSVVLQSGQDSAIVVITAPLSTVIKPDQTVVLSLSNSRAGITLKYAVGHPGADSITIRNYVVPYALVARAVNNPYEPGKSAVPAYVLGLSGIDKSQLQTIAGSLQGQVITAEISPRTSQNIQLTGTVSIYDVVMNTVVKNRPMVFDGATQRLYFVWDGRNQDGRNVALGTYLAVIEIKDNVQKKSTQKIRIGVKR